MIDQATVNADVDDPAAGRYLDNSVQEEALMDEHCLLPSTLDGLEWDAVEASLDYYYYAVPVGWVEASAAVEALFGALHLVAVDSSGALEARYLLVPAPGRRMQAEAASALRHCVPFLVRAVQAQDLWDDLCYSDYLFVAAEVPDDRAFAWCHPKNVSEVLQGQEAGSEHLVGSKACWTDFADTGHRMIVAERFRREFQTQTHQ